jgi:hypothetical protein
MRTHVKKENTPKNVIANWRVKAAFPPSPMFNHPGFGGHMDDDEHFEEYDEQIDMQEEQKQIGEEEEEE